MRNLSFNQAGVAELAVEFFGLTNPGGHWPNP